MLRQKQATLLEGLYKVALHHKGVVVAEELLQSLLDQDAVTRSGINSFISSFLGTDVYVIKHLAGKSEENWLTALDEFVMDILIKKYEEVLTWQVTSKTLLPKE